ncbi:hypothetical protein Cni_G00947 [Canna indica]|uniref:J domain-containing protein n=1 Tax=Canna indica TaxID=4628 RepID=A0AAQ3JLN4_9LILI|nr:hypothetical protein Cni_G00947 [Canna indica]
MPRHLAGGVLKVEQHALDGGDDLLLQREVLPAFGVGCTPLVEPPLKIGDVKHILNLAAPGRGRRAAKWTPSPSLSPSVGTPVASENVACVLFCQCCGPLFVLQRPPARRWMNPGDGKGRRNPWEEREHASRAWGALLFALIGATVTTVAVIQLRRTVDWLYTELKSQSSSSWRNANTRSNHGGFTDETWRRYYRRMQEQHEKELERIERIRRMQRIFNRERNKFKRSHERWRDNDSNAYQHIPRDDWYYNTDTYYREQRANYNFGPRHSGNYSMSHHYSVLGLDWSRQEPFSDAEIKTAFRAKAMAYHPDQNQDNKEAAEAKFKEVMTSYEAIKLERKNGKC